MLTRQPHPQPPRRQLSLDSRRRAPEAAPLLHSSSSFSLSTSSSFSSLFSDTNDGPSSPLILPLAWSGRKQKPNKPSSLMSATASIFRSLFPSLQTLLVPACQWLSLPAMTTMRTSGCPCRRKFTGTFFGHRRGRVRFAVQEDPRSEPLLVLELAIPTCQLVKEMASGMVRILLECEKVPTDQLLLLGPTKNKKRPFPQRPLWEEPLWSMYCNGNKRGFAVSRTCTEADFHVLSTVQTVSVGAGVLPVAPQPPATSPSRSLEKNLSFKNDGWMYGDGGASEVMYMRAKFERVVGGKDSEAFYMISPEGGRGKNYSNGCPELSIFLLRI